MVSAGIVLQLYRLFLSLQGLECVEACEVCQCIYVAMRKFQSSSYIYAQVALLTSAAAGVASLTSHRRGSKLMWYEISRKFREVRGYMQLGLGMW